MKFLLILSAVIVTACNSIESKSPENSSPFTGTWKQISSKRIKGDPKIDEAYEAQFNNPEEVLVKNSYETFLIIKRKGKSFDVSFNVTDQPSIDKCYKVSLKNDQLHFSKKIDSKSDNTYKFKVDDEERLIGEMKSWNGNTYELVFEKMPNGYKIKKTEPRY